MYYTERGELKEFNTYDSAGVVLCSLLGLPVAIVTGEPSFAAGGGGGDLPGVGDRAFRGGVSWG
jgi:hypothetical protein